MPLLERYKLTNTALNEIDQSLQFSITQRWGLNILVVEQIRYYMQVNAYYKKIQVFFFYLACMSTCCWGLPKPKYEPFITHNRGTFMQYKYALNFHYIKQKSDKFMDLRCVYELYITRIIIIIKVQGFFYISCSSPLSELILLADGLTLCLPCF